MFNCCMPNYNMFMGGCCGNNMMNTMFKMQMFKMIMNNIFHPYQQQQPICYPMQQPVMPMMPQMPMMPMQQVYSPSIFPANMQYPSMNYNNNYYNDNSYQGPSLIDIFKDAYNAVFKKKAKKDEESDRSVKSDETDQAAVSDKSEKTEKSDKSRKSDVAEKSDKTEKSDKSKKPDGVEKSDKTEKSDKSKKSDGAKKSDKTEKSDKSKKSDGVEKSDKTKKSEKKAEKKNEKVNNSKKIVISKSEITDIVHKKAEKYGVDEKLILAMINQESGFTNGQTSKKGAKGLMQLMPATAKELGVTAPNDPEQNIDAGVRYMKKLLNRYNGDIKKALAAYNWGMGNLDKYGMQKAPKETRNYVSTIYDNYKNYDVA